MPIKSIKTDANYRAALKDEAIKFEMEHLLKSPANADHLERSIAQYRKRNVTTHKLLNTC